MSIRKFFQSIIKNDEQIHKLKERMIKLEEQVDCLKKQEHQAPPECKIDQPPPIIIEKINVEKIVVDKLEYHNNFGALGIKELKGKLNIGANYGLGMSLPHQEDEKAGYDRLEQVKKENKPEPNQGPRYVIAPKDL